MYRVTTVITRQSLDTPYFSVAHKAEYDAVIGHTFGAAGFVNLNITESEDKLSATSVMDFENQVAYAAYEAGIPEAMAQNFFATRKIYNTSNNITTTATKGDVTA